MADPIGTYCVSQTGLTPSFSNDFFQLRNPGGVRVELLELRVFQTGSTAIMNHSLLLLVGTGGSGGTALTEYEIDTVGSDAVATAHSNAGGITSISTFTLMASLWWVNIHETVWFPTPSFPGLLRPGQQFAVAIGTGQPTFVGISLVWEEYGA